jgi:predicted NUDIX family phosphoesterase
VARPRPARGVGPLAPGGDPGYRDGARRPPPARRETGAAMPDEMVLCCPRSLLDEIGAFQGVQTNVEAYIPRILEAQHTRFIPRSQAEHDPSWKQIIPYVLIRKGDRFLHYVRGKGSGEKRLVALGSMGIGGHINNRDEDLFREGLEFYEQAVQRELHEELRMEGRFRSRVLALLNDETNAVGQVHLGVIHLCDLTDENVSKGEACITDLRFLTVSELLARRDQMETWSQICLDFIVSRLGAA